VPRGKKHWEIREDYRRYMRKAKRLFPTILGHVNIKRVAVVGFSCATSRVAARIYPNGRPWSMLLPDYDYIISVWSTRFDNAEKSFRVFLMLHELLHIPQEGHEEGAYGYRKTVSHDIEDFKWLREAYGIHLDNMKDVLRGEKHLLRKDEEGKEKRFPRTVKIA
jgi:hypothetical protein